MTELRTTSASPTDTFAGMLHMPLPDERLPRAQDCDVLVIGGGPAGSTAATLLAEAGRSVVLLEKDVHPRFHIGESLLPHNLGLIDRLGLLDEVRKIGVYKPGAEFVSDEHGGKSVAFQFNGGIDQTWTYSFHVKRAEFDKLLFDNAKSKGVTAHEAMRVVEVTLAEPDKPAGRNARSRPNAGDHARSRPINKDHARSRVVAEDGDGQRHVWAPRYIVDASGRDTYLANRLKTKSTNKENNTAALFAHMTGVKPLREPDPGNITIHFFAEGWCWVIPLTDGISSIGIVSNAAFFNRRTGSHEEFFLGTIAGMPSLAKRTGEAELAGPVRATGNYSYSATSMVGDGFILVGDAFAFVDPIFSSGVMLAMTGAERGAAAIHVHLDDPRRAKALFREFDRHVRGAIGAFSWLIYRINTPVLRDMFMEPRNKFRMREGLVSLLAGSWNLGIRAKLPVLAFKGAFHFLQLAHRRGYRLRGEGLVPVASLAQGGSLKPADQPG